MLTRPTKFITGILLGLCLSAPTVTFGETEDITFSIVIDPMFELNLSTLLLEYSELEPGNTTEKQSITSFVKSNTGNRWQLSLNTRTDFIDTSDISKTFPASAMSWRYLSPPSSVNPALSTSSKHAISTSSQLIASAASGTPIDIEKGGTQVALELEVAVPENIQAGTYETVLLFTLTEE